MSRIGKARVQSQRNVPRARTTPVETKPAPLRIGGPLCVGDRVSDAEYGVGEVVATQGEPGRFPRAQINGHLVVKFKDAPILRRASELARVVSRDDVLAQVSPDVRPLLLKDPMVPARAWDPEVKAVWFPEALAARILERYVPRLEASQVLLGSAYAALRGKDQAWLDERVRSGREVPEQTLVTPHGEEHIFRQELTPDESVALQNALAGAHFTVPQLAEAANLSENDVREACAGLTRSRATAATLYGARETLLRMKAPRRERVALEAHDALRERARALYADGKGWSYQAMGHASGLRPQTARMALLEYERCTGHVYRALAEGLTKLEQARGVENTTFAAETIDAFLAQLDSLTLLEAELLPVSVSNSLMAIVGRAQAAGFVPDAMAHASDGLSDEPFRGRVDTHTFGTAKKMLKALRTLVGKTPDAAALEHGYTGHFLLEPERQALCARLQAAGYSPAQYAALTDISESTVKNILNRDCTTSRDHVQPLDAAIAALKTSGAKKLGLANPVALARLKMRYAGAKARGWTDAAVGDASNLEEETVRTFSGGQGQRWTVHNYEHLQAGLDRIQRLDLPIPNLGFTPAGIAALRRRFKMLAEFLDPARQLPNHLARALEQVILQAVQAGHNRASIGIAAGVSPWLLKGKRKNGTLATALPLVKALKKLVRKTPFEVAKEQGRAPYLSQEEADALREHIASHGFSDTQLRSKATLSTLDDINNGGGVRRSTDALIRRIIAELETENAPRLRRASKDATKR